MILFLACPFRQVDAVASGERADRVEFALAFEHRLFAAFDFLTGLDYKVGVVVADRVVQCDDGCTQLATRPVGPVVQVSQTLGEVTAAFALDSTRRVQAVRHHPQLVEFPGLDLVVAALSQARRIPHVCCLIASRQGFDALFRAAERLRQRVRGETRRVPVRSVHDHAGERVGHEQMPRAAVPMQHAHGQVDLPAAFGSGQPHAHRSLVFGGDEPIVERQMEHVSAVRQSHADCVERVRRPQPGATEFASRGPVYERRFPSAHRNADAVRVKQSEKLADTVRVGGVEVDQDTHPFLDSTALCRRVQFTHVHAATRGRDDRGLMHRRKTGVLAGRAQYHIPHLRAVHGGFHTRIFQYGQAFAAT